MNKIYNMKKYAEYCLIKKKTDKKVGVTLLMLCRYFYSEKNMSKEKIANRLRKFISSLDRNVKFNDSDIEDLINNCLNKYEKQYDVECVYITKDEMNIISEFDEKQQRVLFAMLVSYKFKNEYAKLNGFQGIGNNIIRESREDIMKDAKLRMNIDDRSKLFSDLRKAGVINYEPKVSYAIELMYVRENSENIIKISNQNDIWVDLEIYKGNKQYKRCECCGDAIKLKKSVKGGVTPKYCSSECSKEINRIKTRENIAKKRNV